MKFYETTHFFSSPFDSVTLASWRKYPNDKTPHVRHVEILSRRVNPVTGYLETERLINVRQNVPSLIKRILGTSGDSFALEYSTVDPNSKLMEMRTVNLTLNNLLMVVERVVYKPVDSSSTEFYQSVQFSADGLISRFSSIVEEYSLNTFKNNAIVGKLGFEQVLNSILLEKQKLATA
ncbi:Protein UPS2, mitochondrial [Smittium culicis]|uniref:Protein UPS2, mitochondrial n=1 Tax=Smittium culicis TaxID=133412 RepID=A0A1R1YE98_9FUNG|nr:Protein UPS2, mitochondrial [Smittium culicis]